MAYGTCIYMVNVAFVISGNNQRNTSPCFPRVSLTSGIHFQNVCRPVTETQYVTLCCCVCISYIHVYCMFIYAGCLPSKALHVFSTVC